MGAVAKLSLDINLLMVDERSFSTVLDHEGYRSVGIQAFMASSPEQVRIAIASHRIDVVLINWEYSRFDPQQIVKEIRAHPKAKDVPIIVTSIHSADDKIAKMKEIDLFVKQPVPRVILLERIRHLLKKKSREAPRLDVHDLYLDTVKVKAGENQHDLKLADISLLGMFLYSGVVFQKGQALELEFYLPGVKKPLKVAGEVIRITRMHKINDKMNKGIGVKFTEFREDSQQILSSYFEQNKPESDFIFYYL